MKVLVKDKFLNVRVGDPSLNAPCYQFLAPGSEIEVDGKLYKGDAFDGIDTWLKDEAGNYYWQGGVASSFAPPPGSLLDYNALSAMPAAVKQTRGTGITIGIVDTGCFRHDAFSQVNITGKNFVADNTDFDDRSTASHGTFVAGVIAAGNAPGSKMMGIAQGVDLLIAKMSDDDRITDGKPVLAALQWLVAQKPDIINCSFTIPPGDLEDQFMTLFQSTDAAKIIWVGAGQDNINLFGGIPYFPASSPNFLAVGSCNSQTLTTQRLDQLNANIKYIVQETMFTSTDRFDFYDQMVGSSFASALITGTLALIAAHLKTTLDRKPTPAETIQFLNDNISQLTSPGQFLNPFTIFRK